LCFSQEFKINLHQQESIITMLAVVQQE